MFRLKQYLPAVALVVALLAVPAQASAADFPDQQYLGDNFSIDSNGWHGTSALIEDLKKDQSTCAAWARDFAQTWTTRQASALADQPHGGSLHQQCVSKVTTVLSNLKFRLKPVGKTRLWRERKQRCKQTCVFRVVGRNVAGNYTLKKVRMSKHRRVLVVVAKKAFRLKGKLVKVGQPFGIGLGGCTNRLGQLYEKITPIKFKLRLKYVAAGKPKPKGKVPGPGDGHSLPPALPPPTPPDNDKSGPTAPPGTPGGGGPPSNGGQCTNSRGEPIPCS